MTRRGRLGSTPTFPSPSERYDPTNEAQFRVAVEREIQSAIQFGRVGRTVSDTFAAGDNDDYDLDEFVRVVRVTANASGSTLTGVANGYDAREVRFINVSGNTLSIGHQDTASSENNRILLSGGATLNLSQNEMIDLQYDPVTARWREVNTT